MPKAFLLGIIISRLVSAASSDPCSDPMERQAWESSPVYTEATDLARLLEAHGIAVECIRRSTEEHLFKGQRGAAWYKASDGIFEVWFLPKTEDSRNLQISEHSTGNGRYSYSFRGLPHVPPRIDSSRRISFIEHGHVLFEVWGNSRFAAKLSAAVTQFKSGLRGGP